MSKSENYRSILKQLDQWEPFMMKESGLPGPRANLELLQVVAEEGDETLFLKLLAYDSEKVPANTPDEYLVVCGIVGLGNLLGEAESHYFSVLRNYASDPRWRVREGVAMALQLYGEKDMNFILERLGEWSRGNLLEKRAVVAALCEPKLLKSQEYARRVLDILDQITETIPGIEIRKDENLTVLKKGLGYGWSVAAVALPEYGKAKMEKWLAHTDKDIRWIMKENLKKDRLRKMDAAWVEKWNSTVNAK